MGCCGGKRCPWVQELFGVLSREMDAALGSLRLTCCVVYIDDVCVHSDGSLADHLLKVQEVMKALRVIGFSGNPAKCIFAQREVTFLGHRVSHGRIFPLEDKVKCIAAPLTNLTKQTRAGKNQRDLKVESHAPWQENVWTREQDRAFETLKGALLTRPVMTLPIKGRKWRLATDASKVAMGAVLSQLDERGEEHPVALYSKKLSPTEAKWDIWELELAAVVWATATCGHSVEFGSN